MRSSTRRGQLNEDAYLELITRLEAALAREREQVSPRPFRAKAGCVIVGAHATGVSRLTPAERARLDAWRDQPSAMLEADRAREAERIADRRIWAVVMLTPDLAVARSILLGRPVVGRQLDARALRRALRGDRMRDPDEYLRVRSGHLDALAEGGPLT